MQIHKVVQIRKREVINITNLDLIIAASGYEERASFITSQFKKDHIEASKKIAIGFRKHKDVFQRKENDQTFIDYEFLLIEEPRISNENIIHYLEEFLDKCNKPEINILIDYSSMTRTWYSAIINYFMNYSLAHSLVNVYFAYSPAQFYENGPEEIDSQLYFNPIDGFCSLSIPNKPTVLIIGLGYYSNVVYGLQEYFEADQIFLFYTSDSKFSKIIEKKNKELINKTPKEHIFKYPLGDLLYVHTILYNLCKELLNDFRIIITPCGPKPFTLQSLLISKLLNNIDVWRIGDDDDISDRIPDGTILTLHVQFASN